MDIQSQLLKALNSLKQMKIGHLRRILRLVSQISDDHFVVSMLLDALQDLNQANFKSAYCDIHTAKIIDERDNFAMQF